MTTVDSKVTVSTKLSTLAAILVAVVKGSVSSNKGIGTEDIIRLVPGFSNQEYAEAMTDAAASGQIVRRGRPGPNGFRGIAAQWTTPEMVSFVNRQTAANPFAALNGTNQGPTMSRNEREEAAKKLLASRGFKL